MKLGTQTGSLVNHMMANVILKDLSIGDGATLLSWTDRHAATIVDFFNKGKYEYIAVTRDTVVRTDENGISENQRYEYTSNLDGHKEYFRVTPKGFEPVELNSETGRFSKLRCGGLMVGRRETYWDPCF